MPSGKLSPASIVTGLLTLDRQTLSTLFAVFQDGRSISLITDKIGNVGDEAQAKYSAWKDGTVLNTEERFSARIDQTAKEIAKSETNDDTLRLALWAHLRSSLDLEPRIAIAPRDLRHAANDIGAQICLAVSQKRKAAERAAIPKKDISYWKKLAAEANPFAADAPSPLLFDEAVRDAILGLFSAALNSDKTSDTQKKEILSLIRKELSNLDQRILEGAKVEALTGEAIQRLLATGGGLIGLMGAVEAAGFGAYILAAQASAIIPLVGGKTLVSALFVISHPLFVLPVLFATGAITANSLTKTVRRAFAVTVGSLLAIRGLEAGKQQEIQAVRLFFSSSDLIAHAALANPDFNIPNAEAFRKLAQNLTRGIILPAPPDISPLMSEYLERPLVAGDQEPLIESFLFPNCAFRSKAATDSDSKRPVFPI